MKNTKGIVTIVAIFVLISILEKILIAGVDYSFDKIFSRYDPVLVLKYGGFLAAAFSFYSGSHAIITKRFGIRSRYSSGDYYGRSAEIMGFVMFIVGVLFLLLSINFN